MTLSLSLAAWILAVIFAVLGFSGIADGLPGVVFRVCFFTMLLVFVATLAGALLTKRRSR